MNEWLKNNLFTVLGLLAVGGGFLLTVYIKAEIAAQLQDAGIVPEYEVTALKEDVQENADDIDTIEDRWNRLVDALAAENSGQ